MSAGGGPQADRSKAMAAGKLPSGSRGDILSADRGTDKFAFEGELGRLRHMMAAFRHFRLGSGCSKRGFSTECRGVVSIKSSLVSKKDLSQKYK